MGAGLDQELGHTLTDLDSQSATAIGCRYCKPFCTHKCDLCINSLHCPCLSFCNFRL
jgi:hypothetical protein